MTSSRERSILVVVGLLWGLSPALGHPMNCRLERGAQGGFVGTCVMESDALPLRLTPPESARRSRRGDELATGTWTGELTLGEDGFAVQWIVGRPASRSDGPEVVFRTPFGWFPLSALEVDDDSLAFTIYQGRMVGPDEVDLAILVRARAILADEASWDRADDRVCQPEDTTFSLYCAMHRASLEETGTFEHRRPALQQVRLAVEHLSQGQEFEHRLRDFNNGGDLVDVQRALALAAQRVERIVAGEPWLVLRPRTTLGVESDRTASLALADLDGDADLDIVVANGRHWPGQNRVYLNNGEGGLGLRRSVGDEQDTSYAAPLADFDEDGDLDIAVGNDRVRNLLYWNDGSGRFTAGPTFGGIESTRGVTLADLDADGHVDILMTNRGDPNVIHFGDGTGGFLRRGTFGTANDSTIAVAVGDVDDDGDLDLALANRDGQGNFVYLNDGRGDFRVSRPYGTGSDETRAVALGDLDGDGDLDIAVGNIDEENAVYLGDGTGTFSERIPFGSLEGPTYAVALDDLDLDGDLDIVVGQAGAENAVYLNRGDGRGFEELRFGDSDSITYGVALGDLDGDGFPEVVTANSDGQNVVYANLALSLRR